jgi:hypothetical protein
MMHTRGVKGVATAALVVVALGACSGGEEPGANPSATQSTASSPDPTASSSTPPSESEVASTAASDTVRRFFETVDLVRQDTTRPADELDTVASSTELLAQKNLLKSQREGGLHQVGTTKIVEVTVESVSFDDPVTALVDVCWDVSGVDILDAEGTSVVPPERKDIGWTRLALTNGSWETTPTDGWRVSGGSDLAKAPCVGS